MHMLICAKKNAIFRNIFSHTRQKHIMVKKTDEGQKVSVKKLGEKLESKPRARSERENGPKQG